ncbi:hypothetical protein SAMN04488548_134173 [Gordonia westfalica]|uniref:Uncharacterized protein n=1 Tax=Gordonia westfalica TaxID=158898 RepID=A0A1H2GY85_9ACTN|nr:hypothetical protein SAMN04488548_134173 [Gordonia westfalica]
MRGAADDAAEWPGCGRFPVHMDRQWIESLRELDDLVLGRARGAQLEDIPRSEILRIQNPHVVRNGRVRQP